MMSSALESDPMKTPFMWQPYPDSFNFINTLLTYILLKIAEMTQPCLPRYMNQNIWLCMNPMTHVPSV